MINGLKLRFISFRIKLLMGFTVGFAIVYIGAFSWFSIYSVEKVMKLIKTDLTNITAGSAPQIDGDRLTVLLNEGQISSDGFSDHSDYLYLLEQLDRIHQIEPRAWPYLYVSGNEDHQIIYLVDLLAKYDPARAAKFIEVYVTDNPSVNELGQTTFRTQNREIKIETDKWGSWISAFAPVRNAQGQVVAGLGVDFEANYVLEVQNEIRETIFLVFLVSYPLLMILVFIISSSLSRPITTLTSMARQIGDGNYDQDFTGFRPKAFPDEISALAEVFKGMLEKVNTREQNLRKQVAALTVEIDEKKRQEDVDEIVETEFFRKLQAKAEVMRKRNKSSEAELL